MAKKNFDDFIESVEKPKRPTPEEAARLVAEVHQVAAPPAVRPQAKPETKTEAAPKPKTTVAKKPKSLPRKTTAPPAEQNPVSRRGRKPSKREETERLYRLSVDLPGSVLLKLKGAAMASDLDMKTYVRELLEAHLKG